MADNTRIRRGRILIALLALAQLALAQPPKGFGAGPSVVMATQPDAERTKQELSNLLQGYPPALRNTLALDPSLLNNPAYLAPYPALAAFLNAHPEIAHSPSFYVPDEGRSRRTWDARAESRQIWRDLLTNLTIFAGLGMVAAVLAWLIRTMVDYRRWSRLAKVQNDAHTKLLDRFTANEDLLAYIQSPAGAKFLESSPIKLDPGPRSVGAPLSRILWSLQGGVVAVAGGIGLLFVSGRFGAEDAQPLEVLGVLGIALGLGLVISAGISYFISLRLGLIERSLPARQPDQPGPEGLGLR